MNDRIASLLEQIAALEHELHNAVHGQENKMFFKINGRRIQFERSLIVGIWAT